MRQHITYTAMIPAKSWSYIHTAQVFPQLNKALEKSLENHTACRILRCHVQQMVWFWVLWNSGWKFWFGSPAGGCSSNDRDTRFCSLNSCRTLKCHYRYQSTHEQTCWNRAQALFYQPTNGKFERCHFGWHQLCGRQRTASKMNGFETMSIFAPRKSGSFRLEKKGGTSTNPAAGLTDGVLEAAASRASFKAFLFLAYSENLAVRHQLS